MTATRKKIMRQFRQAVIDYQMLADDRPIMVGVSGGKDSLTLLTMLKDFLPISKYKYQLAAGYIGLGFETEEDLAKIRAFCDSLEVPLFYEPTEISTIVFDIRKEQSPCSLCAKMRRGALNGMAAKHGFPKVALGHHLDDVIETLLLNMSFTGNVDCFKPVTELTRQGVTVIRPLIYVQEQTIRTFVRQEGFEMVPSCCPADTNTKREEMKHLVDELVKVSPRARQLMLRALQNVQGNAWMTDHRQNKTTNEDD